MGWVFRDAARVATFVTYVAAAACHQGDSPSGSAGADASNSNANASADFQSNPHPTTVSSDVAKACAYICKQSDDLKCEHASRCLRNCLAMGTLTPCADQTTSFYGCLVHQPTQNWKCDEKGVAAIRAGFCDAEQERVVVCMESKMQR